MFLLPNSQSIRLTARLQSVGHLPPFPVGASEFRASPAPRLRPAHRCTIPSQYSSHCDLPTGFLHPSSSRSVLSQCGLRGSGEGDGCNALALIARRDNKVAVAQAAWRVESKYSVVPSREIEGAPSLADILIGKGRLTGVDHGSNVLARVDTRILKAQGTSVKGGAKDYLVNGEMRGGFSMVAFPAEYGPVG